METRRVWPAEQDPQSEQEPYSAPVQPQPGYVPPVPYRPAQTPYPVPRPTPTLVARPARTTPPPPNVGTTNQSNLPLGALIAAAIIGTIIALWTIPTWVPTLATSISGTEPTIFWYLSRASGFVSFALIWLSMASGLIITNKMARVWPGAFTAFDLHQFTSLLGLGFAFFHVLILLGNQYVPYNLVQLFVPFVDAPYRATPIAFGQIALYLLIPVTFTFYIRKQMGNRLWHAVHFLSYPVFALALFHGVFSGTDSGNPWILIMYWAGAASLLALTIHRLMQSKALQQEA